MPKMKTHSGAKKRFKVTGTGKLRRLQINNNHILEKKPSKRMRRLKGEVGLPAAMTILAGFFLLGLLVLCFLPETKDKPLPD